MFSVPDKNMSQRKDVYCCLLLVLSDLDWKKNQVLGHVVLAEYEFLVHEWALLGSTLVEQSRNGLCWKLNGELGLWIPA